MKKNRFNDRFFAHLPGLASHAVPRPHSALEPCRVDTSDLQAATPGVEVALLPTPEEIDTALAEVSACPVYEPVS